MRDPDALIPVGKICATHGIRGQVKLHSYSGNPDSLRTARVITLTSPDGVCTDYGLKSFKANTGRFIIGLRNIDDIDQALPLVGSEVCLRRSQLPALAEDEYYWSDLIGLEVVTVTDVPLGRIADIFETGSNDVYVVRGGGREYLIPAIADVVRSVDPAGGKIIVEPLDGLLDL